MTKRSETTMRRIDNTGEKTGTGKIFSTGTNIKPHEQFMDKKIHKDAGTDNTDQRRLTRKAFEKSFSRLIHINKRSAMTVGLAIVVVFAMTASLIMPAVTLSKQAALKQGGITLESSDLRTAGTLDTTSLSTSSAESKLSKDPLSSGNKDSAFLKSSNGKNSSKGGETSSEPSGRSSSGDSSSGNSSDQSNKSSDPSGKSTDPSDSASDQSGKTNASDKSGTADSEKSDQNTDSGKSDSKGDSSADKSDKSDNTNASNADRSDTSDADKANASDADKSGTEGAKAADAKDTDKEAADKEDDPSEDTKDGLIKEKTELTFAGGDFDVVATIDADAGLPEGTKLQVKEIVRNDKKADTDPANKIYDKYHDDALDAIEKDLAENFGASGNSANNDVKQQVEYSRFFDITFVSEGKEVEPDADVNIKITYDKAVNIDKAENVHIVHFAKDKKSGEEKPELLDEDSIDLSTEKLTGKKAKQAKKDAKGSTPAAKYEMTDTSFDSASFSVYGVVYTVDFHYEVNGETFDYSMEGGSTITLSSLFKAVKVDENVDVADVKDVQFSDDTLAWVGKADAETTIGALKEANGLDCQYSSELTKDQIQKINDKKVDAGDWALISLKPFDSEESLTITMDNGDQFIVKVIDAQDVTTVEDVDENGYYILYVDQYYNNSHHYFALRNDGASVAVPNNNLDALGNDFTWRFGYDGTACWWYNGSNYIEPEWSTVVGDNPAGRYLWIEQRGNSFGIHGNHWSNNYLSWDSTNGFKIVNNGFDVGIKIYEKDKPRLNFSVAVNNSSYGSVSCANTVTDLNWKNAAPIVATPAEGCYFVGWRRGDEVLSGYGPTIPVGGIGFTADNQVLTAVFGKNYTSPATQEINEWIDSLLGNPLTSDKTAHVYDYDNRIYEIDLSASSSRYTIDKDIRIEFITDVSRSMYFPETLLNEQDFTVNGQINLGRWLLDNGDPDEVYYVLADINNTATMYAVYFSGNAYFTRWSIVDASYYLPYDNASTSGRIKTVCEISNGRTTINMTDRYDGNANRIFTGKIYNSTPKPPKDTADWDRLSYLTAAVNAVSRAIYRLDPGAEIGLVTFASSASGGTLYGANDEASLINALQTIQPTGGTNQTSAFNLINNSNPPIFTTNSGKRQVALLITDGAPQGTTWEAIERAAATTEGNDVEIWTLGLALDRVGNNKSRLMNLASDGGYAGNAENPEQLVTETKKILETMLVKATVIGEVYDTVDSAFYPVDSSGNPIKAGFYYSDTAGESVTWHSVAPSDVKKPYYHWVNDNGTWSIAFYNQEIKWPEDGGWNESFYIKAKEDFMGGNTISTNSGVDNRAEANRVKHSSSPEGYYWLNQDHSSFRIDYETPYVNVDELSLTENSTEWTVYLGTEVDPATELRELWDKIQVNQVVRSNDLEDETITITNGNQMYYSDARDNDSPAPTTSVETLPLSYFVNPDLIDTLLNQINNGETTATANLSYRYFPYGHSVVGRFEFSLERTVNTEAAEDGAPNIHETKKKGDEREVYTLKVTYVPVNDGASETYAHTTPGKSAGKVADGYDADTGNLIQSENIHKIHVFAKNLEITKQDMSGNNIDTAKFKLYRTAKKIVDSETGQETTDYESGALDLKVGSETKKVVQIGNEMSTSGGIITVEDLSCAPDGTYYLQETEAPAGYNMLTEPVEMHLYLNNEYKHYLPPKDTVDQAFTQENPYNWTQTVNRFTYNSSEVGTGDASKFVMTVKNNPGVELPNSGGPGTTWIYLLGSILLVGSSIALAARRRVRVSR